MAVTVSTRREKQEPDAGDQPNRPGHCWSGYVRRTYAREAIRKQEPEPLPVEPPCAGLRTGLLPYRRQIRTTLADMDCVCAHLNSQSHLANHVACMGSKPQAFSVL